MADTLQKLANQALVKMGEAGEMGGALIDRARAIDLSRVQDGIKALDVGAKLALAGQGARMLVKGGRRYPLAIAAAMAVAATAAATYFIRKQKEEEAAEARATRRISATRKATTTKRVAAKKPAARARKSTAPAKRAPAKKASSTTRASGSETTE